MVTEASIVAENSPVRLCLGIFDKMWVTALSNPIASSLSASSSTSSCSPLQLIHALSPHRASRIRPGVPTTRLPPASLNPTMLDVSLLPPTRERIGALCLAQSVAATVDI